MKKEILLVGGGGHCKVVMSIIDERDDIEVFGISDDDEKKMGMFIDRKKIAYSQKDWQAIIKRCENAHVAFGSVDIPYQRKKIWESLRVIGFKFPPIISKQAKIARDVQIGCGTVIMPGVVINPGVVIGNNCIINTGAIIDHDCTIGDHSHIAPGVVLSGTVETGEMTHIGTGVIVIQGIKIGQYSLIAAGAVVVKDVPDYSKAMGVPAKLIRTNQTR